MKICFSRASAYAYFPSIILRSSGLQHMAIWCDLLCCLWCDCRYFGWEMLPLLPLNRFWICFAIQWWPCVTVPRNGIHTFTRNDTRHCTVLFLSSKDKKILCGETYKIICSFFHKNICSIFLSSLFYQPHPSSSSSESASQPATWMYETWVNFKGDEVFFSIMIFISF